MSADASTSMKTERVTLLTTPEFKAYLTAAARCEGVSVAELVRARCERRESPDEMALRALAKELSRSVAQAQVALRGGLDEANAVLMALREARQPRPAAAAPSRTRAMSKVPA